MTDKMPNNQIPQSNQTLSKPTLHRMFIEYMADVQAWHGYIRLLGIPSLQLNNDIAINELYVDQNVSRGYLSPDYEPEQASLLNPINLLANKHRVVILGDPGSGKSTFVNYITWVMANVLSDRLPQPLRQKVVIPIILREMSFNGVNNFKQLIEAYLTKPIAQALHQNLALFWQYVEQNQAVFLLDGLDEVEAKNRQKVVAVVKDGFTTYKDSFFLITSRIVGYQELPITFAEQQFTEQQKDANEFYQQPAHELEPELCYVAPFTQIQVRQFALHWYTGSQQEIQQATKEFIAAINATETTKTLARTPNLLAMMAMIYKVRVRLPNGRAMLYEDIAQAYLESIDTARKLSDPIPWRKKKLWLARIGFEMQLRRYERQKDKQKEKQNEDNHLDNTLLASKTDIIKWLTAAMKDSGDSPDKDYIERYISWIIRRSGLLIPRGENKFAFLHLSFQEYFAAIHIKTQLENPSWFDDDEDIEQDDPLDSRVNQTQLAIWGNELVWKQTLIALFELFHDKPGWSNKLWKYCFKKDAEQLLDNKPAEGFYGPDPSFLHIRIELLTNLHVNISDSIKSKALRALSELAIKQVAEDMWEGGLLSKLLSYPSLNEDLITQFKQDSPLPTIESIRLTQLDNNNPIRLDKILPFLPKLKQLILDNFSSLQSLNLIDAEKLPNLDLIQLVRFNSDDITPLTRFSSLTTLSLLSCDNIKNYSPLSQLPQLKYLIIRDKSVINNGNYNFAGIDRDIIVTLDEFIKRGKIALN